MHFIISNIKYLKEIGKLDPTLFSEHIGMNIARVHMLLSDPSTITLPQLKEIADYTGYTMDYLYTKDIESIDEKIKNKEIKMILSDVDGVLTDGGMNYTASGDEFKKFNTKDGIGIKLAIKNNLLVGFISSGFDERIIRKRTDMLGVPLCYVGSENKINIMNTWIEQAGLQADDIAYIGDDINDMECMGVAGLSVCPSDAHPHIQAIADIKLINKGGEGCFRALVDLLQLE